MKGIASNVGYWESGFYYYLVTMLKSKNAINDKEIQRRKSDSSTINLRWAFYRFTDRPPAAKLGYYRTRRGM